MLFLVLMSDINQNIEESKIMSFADDTRLYTPIYSVDDCDSLLSDLRRLRVYMTGLTQITWFSILESLTTSVFLLLLICLFVQLPIPYTSPEMNLIAQHEHIKDLGVLMSADCSFDHHISVTSKNQSIQKHCIIQIGFWLSALVSTSSQAHKFH